MKFPDVIQDRYEMERLLGRGRFAEVWLARDRRAGGAVRALKIFHSGAFGMEPAEWARREFSILRPLRHPRIVPVLEFDVMRGGGQPFYTLQPLFGDDIVTALRRLSLEEALGHIVDLCRGLEYMHSKNLVHGDVKPQNVILDRERGVVLTDPLLPPPLPDDVLPPIYGTVGFQAPEILRRERTDQRADLYSLGVILYQVLVGRPPFEARDPVDLIRLQLSRDPVDVALLDPNIPSHLCEIVAKLLKRDPDQRFEKPAQVILALSRGSGRGFSVETAATRSAYLIEPPLVGREEERTTAFDLIKRLAAPQSERRVASLLLHGPRGIGKSRLLAELLRDGAGLGIEVLHAPTGQDPLFGVFQGYLERVWERVAPELPPQLSTRLQQYLQHAELPESPDQRDKLVSAIATALLKAAQDRALLLTVEDLAALPPPAFKLFAELLGAMQNEKLLLVATACEDDLDETRASQLKRFVEEGFLREVRLAPLTQPQLASMLDAMFDRPSWSDDLARRLVESSGGRPALAVELLSSQVENGSISRERERWVLDPTLGELPLAPSVTGAIERRFAALKPEAKRVAACLALIERPVSFEGLLELFPDRSIDLRAQLETLAQNHFLRAVGERVVLSPPDVAKLALRELPSEQKRELHAALLENLLEHPQRASIAELATHAIGMSDPHTIQSYAPDAGREAMRQMDYERALFFFDNALLHVSAPEERSRILLDLAGLRAAVGDLKGAIATYEELVKARDRLDESLLARALSGLAQVHLERGDLLEGRRVVGRLSNLSRRAKQSSHASAMSTLATLLMERGEYQEARPLYSDVLRAHRASGNKDALRWTLHHVARLHELEGHHGRAFRLLGKLLLADRDAGDETAAGEAEMALAELRGRGGDLLTAEKICLEITARASELGDRSLLMKAYLKLGIVYAHLGESEQALKWLSRTRTLAIASGHSLLEAEAEAGLGLVRCMGYRLHEGLSHYERALHLHRRMERQIGEAESLIRIAACEHALNRYEAAIQNYEQVLKMPDVPGMRPQRAAALTGRASVLVELGALDLAEADLNESLQLLDRSPPSSMLAAAHAELGWVHLERGSTAWARDSFQRALAASAEPEFDSTVLHARAGLAELSLRAGDREAARKNVNQLLQDGERAGQKRFLAKAHLLLAELLAEKADAHLVESHLTDAVLLAEAVGDKELLRAISYRSARQREQLGHSEEALDLFRRATELTDQLCASLSDPVKASTFRRSHQRDRASKAVKRLSERASATSASGSPLVAPSAEVLLKHVLTLTQCKTPESLLDRTVEAVLEIANMPLGFARVHTDEGQDLLRCVGSAEDETLHSPRLEGPFAVAERALRTGEVLLCPDSQGTPEFADLMEGSTHPLRSFLCLPLPSAQRPSVTLGVLFAGDFRPRSFNQFPTTQQLLKLMRAAASHLEPLLEVQGLRRMGSSLRGENRALVTLQRTAQILAGTGELADRLGDAVLEIVEATGARQGGVVKIEEGRPEILCVRTRRGARIPLEHPVSRGMLDLVLATGERVWVEDATSTPPFRNFESVDNLKIRSCVLSPVRIDGQIAAAVFADQGDLASRSLTREAAHLVEAFADQVGAALDNARLGRALSRSKRELEAIFEDAPFPMAACDSSFVIRAFNRAAEHETGFARGEIVGVKKAHFLVSPREGNEVPGQLLRELGQSGGFEGEVWMSRSNGTDFLAHLNLRSMTSAEGEPLGYAGIFRNITQERDAEATIQRFQHILQVLSEGVLVADAEGRITFANEAVESIYQYERGELIGKHMSVLLSPGTKPSVKDILRLAKNGAWRGEVMCLGRDSSLTPIALSVSWVRGLDGQPRATVAIISDIRDRKRHEDELRRLSARVIKAQEEERRRLSRELHDESAQALTALLLNLEVLGRLRIVDEESRAQLGHCTQIVRDTMAEFKRIAADLHPAVLDKFGLVPALKKHCQDFAQNSALEVTFDPEPGFDVAPSPWSTALYRIAQQALANVARHAQATRIAVRLRKRGSELALTVADDGQGFDLRQLETSDQEGIGLISMRERIAAFGGSFKIRSVPGKGTSVRACVPLGEIVSTDLAPATEEVLR